MKRNNFVIIATLAAAALLLTACGGGEEKLSLDDSSKPSLTGTAKAEDGNGEAEANQDDETQQVQTVTVREIAALTSYASVGSFVADDDLFVSSKIGGTLVALNYDKGDSIRSGKKVAQVDTENFDLMLENAQAQLEVAKANLKLARTEFERKKKLFDEGAIPSASFDAVATQLDLAVAQKSAAEVAIKQAEKSLRDTITYSPVSGVVSHRHVSTGEFIGAGDPIITVSVMNPMKLVFSVPERLAPRITIGTEITVSLSAFPGRTFNGKITLVGPTVNMETRSVPVEATFANDNELLKPGFFAEVSVPLSGTQRQFQVATAALHSVDNGYVVIEAGSGRRIPVSVISSNDRESVITGNLSGGMTLQLER